MPEPTDGDQEPNHRSERPEGSRSNAEREPGFDVDAYDSDGDGSLDTTVLTTVEGVDLDGDGVNDAALMTSQSMTDLDGDGLPDVIETTKTMIHEGAGDFQVVQATERVFVEHGEDPDQLSVLHRDDDDGPAASLLGPIQHIAVCVDDIAAADRFYIDQLGLERIARPDIGIAGTWLQATNGVQIHLVEIPGSAGPDSNHLAFTVDDVDAVAAELRSRGVEVGEAADIGTGKQIFIRDPSGNIVELNEPTHLR